MLQSVPASKKKTQSKKSLPPEPTTLPEIVGTVVVNQYRFHPFVNENVVAPIPFTIEEPPPEPKFCSNSTTIFLATSDFA